MSVITSPLASFSAVVTQVGGTGVGFYALVEQRRAETVSGVTDFGAALTFSAAFVGAYDNISQRVRWTGVRLVFDGSDLHPSAYYGRISEEETMVPGQQRTMRFSPIGHLWAMPTADYAPPPGTGDLSSPTGSETPPSTPPPDPNATTPFSPRSWGNKPVELHLSFGASPRTMVESKLYQGVTLQKSNHGDVAITGDITCVDDSIKYANIPLCYELAPFGAKTRDQIVREMAENIGVPAIKVFVPRGGTVTKPILLSNGSLLPFVNELGAPENWFAYFDKDGNFVVEVIELKTSPDWTIDARRGDYDYDAIEETPPAMPPTRYYASGTVPVTGTGSASTPTVTDIPGLYNPQCVKVRPSGGASYLQPDGSYRSLAAAESMVIARVETQIVTVDGRETGRVITTYGMYNPLKYDPNFDTDPPGTTYDGAYGDKTFHRDEVESLIVVRVESTNNVYDTFGTLQRRTKDVIGWHAPHRAGNWSADRQRMTNVAGVCFVFPGGTTRTVAQEQYQTIGRVDETRNFGADGAMTDTDTKTFEWFSPSHWADITSGTADPDAPPPPPPDPPPPPPPWGPSLLGPTARQQLAVRTVKYTFTGDATGIPPQPGGAVTTWTLTGNAYDSRNTFTIVGETVPGVAGSLAQTLHLTITYPALVYKMSRYDPLFRALLRVDGAQGGYVTPRYIDDPSFGGAFIIG